MVRALAAFVVLAAACEQPPAVVERPAEPEPPSEPASALAPAPAPTITGTALTFVDRRGDVAMRHGGMMALGLSRNGRFAASGSWEGSVAVWDLRDGHVLRWLQTPHGNLYGVAVSDNGALLATTGHDGVTRIWNVATGTQRWEAKNETRQLHFVANDGRLVGQAGSTIYVWNAADGNLLSTSPKPQDRRWAIEDGDVIADDASIAVHLEPVGFHEEHHGCVIDSVPGGYSAQVLDVYGKQQQRVGVGWAQAVAVSPKGERFAVVGQEDLLVFGADAKPLAKVDIRGKYAINQQDVRALLAASPRYAVTWDRAELAGWDLLAKREVWRVAAPDQFREPQVAGGDTIVISARGTCTARRISDGAELWHRDQCLHVATSPSSSLVLVDHGATVLDPVDATTGTSRFALASTTPLGTLSDLAVSPDGKRVAGVATDRSLWLWDAKGARTLVPPPDRLWTPSLKFLANGKLIVVNDAKGMRVHRYDVDKNAIEATRLLELGGWIADVGVYAAEQLIVEVVLEHNYKRVQIDLNDFDKSRTLPMMKQPSHHIKLRNEALNYGTIDAAAKLAYVPGDENFIRKWDLRTGRLLATSTERNGFVRRLVLTPDEKHLLVPRDEGPILVLETAKLTEVRRLDGPKRYLTAAAISPDGKLVAATALDGLYVWKLADGARVATVDFSPAQETPSSLVFSPDGSTLRVGTDVGTLLQFRVAP